ncbi:GNAT family N-acetyltransferase [Pandoraea iniqua]|uniref:GNAT family N-acetyltransferase n=1 Tax=Pandoraea iniqua TaxID=2508288 RepID=UPI0012517217|nr:GNAT family N-acetyltransferase [Pandoraea iniqua]VVE57674.1 GNAT family N-acetyltransferase [Pandoraea iniqua]
MSYVDTNGRAFVIEAVRPADLPVLAQLYLDVRRQTMTWLSPDRFRYEDFASDAAGETIQVARAVNDEILGFISVWPADNFIHMLYVRETSQGAGVGAALLKALPDWPSRGYRLKCLVKNSRATSFYLRHGFVVVGAGASEEGDYEDLAVTLGE